MRGLLWGVAVLFYLVVGIWGLAICVGILVDTIGVVGAIAGFIFFPVALVVAPWIPVVASGNWFPVVLIYGGGFVATVLLNIAGAMQETSD